MMLRLVMMLVLGGLVVRGRGVAVVVVVGELGPVLLGR